MSLVGMKVRVELTETSGSAVSKNKYTIKILDSYISVLADIPVTYYLGVTDDGVIKRFLPRYVLEVLESAEGSKSEERHSDSGLYVPYQLCPKCNGDKTVFVQQWGGSETSVTSGPQTCDICGGVGVMPMHVVV